MPDGSQPTLESNIEPIEIQEEMERSFLDYAMSVIVSRALPDARDGLKPVHRRILYGMYDRGLRPERPYTKCAQVVGHVMGNYHPHGDTAIYDALARMAQSFSLRYPLVDGHGNFGSPDPNDRPAAMRYCLAGDVRIRQADGATVAIGEVANAAPSSDLDLDLKVLDRNADPVHASRYFHSGDHPTRRLRTKEGFELTGTQNHPVLCLESVVGVPMLMWRLLEELEPGAIVAINRTPRPERGLLSEREWRLAFLAGALVSEGFATATRAGFSNLDAAYLREVVDAYDALVGGPRYVHERTIKSGSHMYELDIHNMDAFAASPMSELMGHRSAEKRVPSFVWNANAAFKQAFLRSLFEGDGSCSDLARSSIQISYSTRSKQLAHDVQLLLLELGVISRQVHYAHGEIKVVVTNRRDARLFASNVGFYGAKQEKLMRLLETVPLTSRAMSKDHVPFMAAYIRADCESHWLDKKWLVKHNIDRIERWERDGDEIMRHIASDEVRAVVEPIVRSGYYFAEVASVEDAGVRPVYSIRVDSDDHSFLANGFVNHNTEARMAPLAMQLLAGIDEDTVEFIETYDGKTQEPAVLPARFPNLLVNGGGGIAVGMATNIPPHNLGEVVDATTHLLDHPDATPEDLMKFVLGPDFPTGALILGKAGIHDTYKTGRGSIKMRAVAEIEEGRKGDQRIVVTEVPYQTSVETIGNKIADLVQERKIEGIRDVRNESSRTGGRLVVELKRDGNAQVVLNQLYKHTPMQTSFGVIMLALVDGVPKVLNLAEALNFYVAHQVEVVTRRTEYRLRKARERSHIVEGLLKALDMLDEVIALIRGSDDVEEARAGLMVKPFEFSEVQANHILDMPLRRLTGLEHQKLRNEHEELQATIKELESILASDKKLRAVIKDELAEVRGEVRRRAAHRDHVRQRRSRRARPHRRRRSGRRAVAQGLHQDRGRGRVSQAGPGRPRRQGRQSARRGLRRAPLDDDCTFVSLVLL